MATKSERMYRLYLRLRKIGYMIHTVNGCGQDCIAREGYQNIADTEYWIIHFLEKKISSEHIWRALVSGRTPYEVADELARRREKRTPRKPKKQIVTDRAPQVSQVAEEADSRS